MSTATPIIRWHRILFGASGVLASAHGNEDNHPVSWSENSVRHMTRHYGSHLSRLVFAISLLLLIHRPVHASTTPCHATFAAETGKPSGWLGGDAAYSIPLPDGRDVWIFGDTLYGSHRIVHGNDPQMVHNSIGISTCANRQWQLRYFLRQDKAGQPTSFFSPKDATHWYWALDGFYAKGDLWVTLLCLRAPARPVASAMNFETCGVDLAQVSQLDREPQQWKVTVHPLVADGVKAYPSATTVVHDGYAYLFALYESGTRPLLVTRIPVAALDKPAAHLEYLGSDDAWHAGFDPAHAKEVMRQGSPELSIRYHPELGRWVAVSFAPDIFSDRIILRTAPTLTGPWTSSESAITLYRVPETRSGSGPGHEIFCYAAKEHPELETPEFGRPGEIVFTYVCNAFSPSELVVRPDIYRPQVVRVPMPAAVTGR